MAVSFDQPLLLGLLPPCLALVYYLWHTSRVYLPPTRRYLALALRALAVTCLLAALSGPTLRLNASDLNEVILLDQSNSITPAQRADEEAWVADALAHKGPKDQIAVVSFAGDSVVERPLSADATPPVYAQDS